jgi:nicotinamidase-related amidase/type 1 glutamine amidotransferase
MTKEATDMSSMHPQFQLLRLVRKIVWAAACCATLTIVVDLVGAESSRGALLTIHKRLREEMANGSYAVREKTEQWEASETAVILCDMWDAHHCLNAVRRAEEMAPRMNQVLESARNRGALILHAPSSCMEPYQNHPARRRAQEAPPARNLPKDIGEWCRLIPSEEKGKYPIDQSDGGEDDDPVEHEQWHQRLAGMGRNPQSPWKAEIDLLKIQDKDAISDSGVEVWNLLEHRRIKNVILMGVHANMCVLGRPFGLRQMAKNGKNVVLMRDLTDTMYNPERWPYVTHFVGTELIVEHIEKFVCPTITSVDFLGGEPFRFKNDRRSILMVIGEDEYQTELTLPAFARQQLEPHGFRVRWVHADPADKNNFPGLAQAVAGSDLVLISVRRRTPPRAQLDAIHAHLAAGKPLVGIRTASHAFAVGDQSAPLAKGATTWPEFDPEVLGGHYTGHHGVGPEVAMAVAPGAERHPILRGVDVTRLVSKGSLYRVTPLAGSTTPLVIGSIPGQNPEPVAWTNSPRTGQPPVFYTSLGHPDDFQNPAFRKLLLNGICWALGMAAPGSPPEQIPASGSAAK